MAVAFQLGLGLVGLYVTDGIDGINGAGGGPVCLS